MKLSIGFFLVPLVIVILGLLYSAQSFSPVFNRGDFRAQFTGASLVYRGNIKQLYNLDKQLAVQRSFLPTLPASKMLPFYSPPVLVLVLSPLGAFPFAISYLIFGFSQLAFLIISLGFLAMSVKTTSTLTHIKKRGITRWHLLLLITGCCTIWMSIVHGQLSSLWMMVIAAGWFLFIRKRYIFSGILFSILSLKMHLVLTPLIFFVLMRKWRVVLGIITGIGIIVLFSTLLIGIEGMGHYLRFLVELSTLENLHGVSTSHQTSLLGLVAHITLGEGRLKAVTLPPQTIPVWFLLVALYMIYTVYRWLSISDYRPHITKLKFAHALVAMLFTSIHTHSYDLSILFISLILYFDYILSVSRIHTKPVDRIQERYKILFILVAITILTGIIPVFTPTSILIFATLSFLIEKEYGKIHR